MERAWCQRLCAVNKQPDADWGALLRSAFPEVCKRHYESFWEWKDMNIPICIDGEPKENAHGPCKGSHYRLGHQVEVEKYRLTWSTWTLENQTIKMNSSYDFQIMGQALELQGGSMNLFANGWIEDKYGNLGYELLEELTETTRRT